eukprot:289361-Amphidinium_carterae.1
MHRCSRSSHPQTFAHTYTHTHNCSEPLQHNAQRMRTGSHSIKSWVAMARSLIKHLSFVAMFQDSNKFVSTHAAF